MIFKEETQTKTKRFFAAILCLVLVIGLSAAVLASDPTVTWHRFFLMETDDYYAYGLGGYTSYFAVAKVQAELYDNSDLVSSQCHALAHVQGKDNNERPWVYEIDRGTLFAEAKGTDDYARITHITCEFEWLDHLFSEEDFRY